MGKFDADEVLSASEGVSSAEKAAEDGWIDAKRLEVAGVRYDKFGNKFAVPNENITDLDDLGADSGYRFPDPEEGFEFILIGKQDLGKYLRLGARPVDTKEIGIPQEMIDQYGQPVTSIHSMYDAILVKAPIELRALLQERKNKEARARFNEVNNEDLRKTKKGVVDDGFQVKVQRSINQV